MKILKEMPLGPVPLPANLPDLWGEGAIFAFSGLDGETRSASGFVLSFDQQPYDFLIHTPRRARLEVRLPGECQVQAALNDLLQVRCAAGELAVTFSAWHTLVGSLPAGVEPCLAAVDNLPEAEPAADALRAEPDGPAVLVLAHGAGRFALAYGACLWEARSRAVAGLLINLPTLLARRLEWISRLPQLAQPGETRFLRKCASVMKVNTLSPEASIRRRWSTPDRIPHRHMWLWDSVFHSIGMNWIDPGLSWEFLQSMLAAIRPDGCMPITVRVDGSAPAMTQPPVLAWGVWENYQANRQCAHLEEAAPNLAAYLEWNLANRDQNGNGLLEWLIEENERCRSGESGMDNSPRFDSALTLDAVDFSTFQALDMACLARIYTDLGRADAAAVWQERARKTSQAIHARLWNPELQFYCDRDLQGRFTNVRASSGFLPLLLPDLPPAHRVALQAALADPRGFASAFPIPSLALDHPQFSTDMWRGATWINFNYLVILGLRQQGLAAQARALAETSLAEVRRSYEQFGVIFEFFDSTGQRTPPECDRKGPRTLPYDIRRKYDSIRDYHWTAALCLSLLFQREKGLL